MTKKLMALFLCLAMCLGLTACGAGGSGTAENSTDISDELTYTDSTKLEYAQKFTIDNYEGGYALITVADDGRFLVVPEGKEAPADLAKDITVLQQPIQNGHVRIPGRPGQYSLQRHQSRRLVYRRGKGGHGERRHSLCGQIFRAGL